MPVGYSQSLTHPRLSLLPSSLSILHISMIYSLDVQMTLLTPGHRRQHEEVYTNCSMTMTKNWDITRISSKVMNVFIDPMQGSHLIHETKVTSRIAIQGWKESCRQEWGYKKSVRVNWPYVLSFNTATLFESVGELLYYYCSPNALETPLYHISASDTTCLKT